MFRDGRKKDRKPLEKNSESHPLGFEGLPSAGVDDGNGESPVPFLRCFSTFRELGVVSVAPYGADVRCFCCLRRSQTPPAKRVAW
jgi:hypothetical protein